MDSRTKLGLFTLLSGFLLMLAPFAAAESAPDPWTAGELLTPEQLAQVLSDPESEKPIVIHVGYSYQYDHAHIAGALHSGPASTASGLADLEAAAQRLPGDKEIVIYCGCCPWSMCPNIRPAYAALRKAGLAQLKVLEITSYFTSDWVDKGYPVDKAK